MKRTAIWILILLSTLVFSGCATTGTTDPRSLTFAPLDFQLPKAERVVLTNGMIVYLLADHELPQITITGYVRTGSAYEPEDKVGLAALTGHILRSGGAESIPPEQIDDELEFMASSVESSIGQDAGTTMMNSLTKNFDRTLAIYAQVLMKPLFRQDRFEVARKQTIEQIRRQNDDPKQLADRELTKAVYQGSPLGRIPTVATVSAITRPDLIDFHRRYYRPNNMILAIAGDFQREELLAKLEQAFSGWQPAEVTLPSVQPPTTVTDPDILYSPKQISQSVIRMGHLGIDKSNPDLYAIRVMDSILGSNGFNSRLMAEIRTNRGLAYSVGSYFDIGRCFIGTFEAQTETKAGATVKTIRLMEDIIAGMTKEQVTDEELQLAKESIVNSFIFGFTNPASVVSQQARLEYYGYPPEYLEKYRERISEVTKEDVLRVAKQYLHPDRLIRVVVGEQEKFDEPLSALGKVREVRPEQAR